jgi:hypothetical protein
MGHVSVKIYAPFWLNRIEKQNLGLPIRAQAEPLPWQSGEHDLTGKS